MKQRLLVMNGQRLVQSEQSGQWSTDRVEKAGALRPGIYNFHLALQADKAKAYEGTVIHADRENVYQQVGKAFVKHSVNDFGKAPEIGSNLSIKYIDGSAVQTPLPGRKLGRSVF